MLEKEVNPCFISSYVPRQCGIATFTNNLFISYQSLYPCAGKVIAVDDNSGRDYPPEVEYVFSKNKISGYIEAAEYINDTNVQAVNLQHEFGLFGGPEGRHIGKLLERLKKPVVTTVHTVLQSPNQGYYTSFVEVIHHSRRVVVMSNKAVEILRKVYSTPAEKIVLIPHGVPDLPFMEPNYFKKELGFAERFVILSFGLLSPGKGIEVVLEALPEVVKNRPDVLYVILGKTHPEVVRIHGEKYRESLQKLVGANHLENNVLFIDSFVTNDELFNFINSADIYITTYLSQEQITSGTLSYAIALGKVVVSTPYWHAREALAGGRGYLVPFNDPKALAETLTGILSKPEDFPKVRQAAYEYGRTMIWPRVSEQYQHLFREVYRESAHKNPRKTSIMPKSSRDYFRRRDLCGMFERLTDDTGIFQHTKYGIPDLRYGYCADDAGRALGVIMRAARFENEFRYNQLARKYLSFILYTQREDGGFHNFVGYDRRFLDKTGCDDDTFGRVLLGLGGAVALSSDPAIAALAKEIFDQAIAGRCPDLPLSTHPKAIAYAMCGLYDYLKKYAGASHVKGLLRAGADCLVGLYHTNKRTGWEWYGPTMTYANAKVPYALLLAHNIFKEDAYRDIALKTLGFLTDIQYNGEYFDIVGNQNWLTKGAPRAYFDQQPIEIGYLVETYCEALRQTQDENYRNLANKAFSWFSGNNRLGTPVYNLQGDYPLDGLTENGSNENSGAESIITFALGVTCLKEISNKI